MKPVIVFKTSLLSLSVNVTVADANCCCASPATCPFKCHTDSWLYKKETFAIKINIPSAIIFTVNVFIYNTKLIEDDFKVKSDTVLKCILMKIQY